MVYCYQWRWLNRFQSPTYFDETVKLQFYVTDEVGFKTCDFSRGRVLPGFDERSSSLLVTPQYLSQNINYFIGN